LARQTTTTRPALSWRPTTIAGPRLRFLEHPLALVGAALIAALVTGLIQLRERAPLVWDESYRVSQGAYVAYKMREGNLGAVWDWFNAQTFYPFLLPTIHAVVYFFTTNPLLSAWLPALVGYTLAGLLAARLAAVLGAGPVGVWAAALLCWLTPLSARLAAGAFTEPLGSCFLLIVALVLAHLGRRADLHRAPVAGATVPAVRHQSRLPTLLRDPDVRLGILLSAVVALSFFLKYDYGLLAGLTAAATGVISLATRRSVRSFGPYLLAGWLLIVPVTGWLALDFEAKWSGVRTFVGQALPSPTGHPDPLYYLQILFGGRHVKETVWLGPGLAPGIAILLLAGVAWAIFHAWRHAAIRGAVILVLLWYAIYSEANWQDPRYLGTILPTVAALTGAAIGYGIARLRQLPRTRPLLAGTAIAALLLTWQLGQQIFGPTGLTTQATFLHPNEPVAAALDFAASSLVDERGPVILIGHTNELSQHALVLAWSNKIGRASNTVIPVPEPGTPESPRAASTDVLLGLMRAAHSTRVVGLDVRPGSSLDTEDFRVRWPSQPQYIRFATQLEQQGVFKRVNETTTENGHLGVIVWQLQRQILNGRPTFNGTVPGGVAQATFGFQEPVTLRWTAPVDRAKGTFTTQPPLPLPPGDYTLYVGRRENKGRSFTVTTTTAVQTLTGTTSKGTSEVLLTIRPPVPVQWVAPVDPATGAYSTTPPFEVPPGPNIFTINGHPVLALVVVGQ